MSETPLLQERYAPDEYAVLVICVFLNQTRASRAAPYIEAFLDRFPTRESLRHASTSEIRTTYFEPLGKPLRACTVVRLAKALLDDPPQPFVLRGKIGEFDTHLSEVGHLPGVGEYASDAWHLFCRQDFYARHDIRVAEQWKSLHPGDRVLNIYVQRRRRDEDKANEI
ncbi:hypothetical protein LTS00_018217, partial [Friedmanniomyces endolithicus]